MNNQYLLHFIVFTSGAVLMGFEIIGSRVLAPYFGNSIFVWGSLISVVLAALSVGYYWGGWLSTRNPSFMGLLVLLLIPGVLIYLVPFIYPHVNLWIAQVNFGNRMNPLIASMIIFLPPSIFLGTISPYAVRLSATALTTVGSTAGTLYALSTAGSIFGTLFTAFYLIPILGVTGIVHSLGLTLVILTTLAGAVFYLRRSLKAVTIFWLAMVSGFMASTGLARAKVIFEKDTFYHRIKVEQDSEARYLYFDRTLQSAMTLKEPTSLRLLYPRFTSLGLTLRPEPQRVLIIGLGGGSIAKKYQHEFPSMEVDVAEIDPVVIEVAKKYFHFKEDKNVRVHAQDGRLFLMRAPRLYDLVLLDAYYADAVPFHLTTKEFFQIAGSKLSSKGAVVVNMIGSVTGPRSKIVRSMIKTIRGIFPQLYIFPTLGADEDSLWNSQNIIIVASKDPVRVSIQEIVKRATSLGRGLFPESLRDISDSYYDGPIADDDVPELTDDYAPTDSLLQNY